MPEPGAKTTFEIPYEKVNEYRIQLECFNPGKSERILSAFWKRVEVIYFTKRPKIFAVIDV
jgi:hypothetical protein